MQIKYIRIAFSRAPFFAAHRYFVRREPEGANSKSKFSLFIVASESEHAEVGEVLRICFTFLLMPLVSSINLKEFPPNNSASKINFGIAVRHRCDAAWEGERERQKSRAERGTRRRGRRERGKLCRWLGIAFDENGKLRQYPSKSLFLPPIRSERAHGKKQKRRRKSGEKIRACRTFPAQMLMI